MYSNDHSIAYNARDPADPHHLNPMDAVRITFALLYLGRTEQARSHEKPNLEYCYLMFGQPNFKYSPTLRSAFENC